MTAFPRTMIEDLSVSRMVIGTNWFLGFSHTSKARDNAIKTTMTASKMADVLKVFLAAGVDTIMGLSSVPLLREGMDEASQRTGLGMKLISTPIVPTEDTQEAWDETARLLDAEVGCGAAVCMPHMVTTDALVDKVHRRIRRMDRIVAMIRQRGMIPGLSTHTPEAPVFADESGLDVATYIQIYNAAGFLMHVEVDWVHRSIWDRKRPVIAIKPLAAGRLLPLVGLAFVWSTLRTQDMVAVGTSTPEEAAEVIELSLSLLEHRASTVQLQRTRSKALLESAGD
ncbi:MAG: hypothetical protein GX591_00985 [Planctomycetes bacterium]|nr:hypothetical protein [Planctomycetota bacterium]